MPQAINSVGLTNRQINYLSKVIPNVDFNHIYDEQTLLNEIQKNANAILSRSAYKVFSSKQNINKVTLIDYINFECMELSNFDWIDTENERLCDYIWSYVRILKPSTPHYNFYIDKADIFNTGKGLNLTSNYLSEINKTPLLPKDNKAKKASIICFFDLLNNEPKIKNTMLNTLKEKWIFVSKIRDVVQWVDSNNKEWAWNYLYKGSNPIWFIENGHQKNHLNGIITTFDLLNDAEDRRELLLAKMKSAWSQKTYRDKNNGKKSVSIVLSEDIIKRLDFICETTDRRKNEVVTRLIREEYEQIKKGGH
ncbi:ribbon-helix-helix domain-containing protein [Aeromonas popoffii]|uniref:ribbon-helix-helix domain-containing protein n=1 Tax=Aeromonas popoffii TaxID=70856 RepID=UPI0005A79C9E|nr:ribbon-helix-helix domain-containing protein [Aeromonas popoffii]